MRNSLDSFHVNSFSKGGLNLDTSLVSYHTQSYVTYSHQNWAFILITTFYPVCSLIRKSSGVPFTLKGSALFDK